jgi:hypothetical protein
MTPLVLIGEYAGGGDYQEEFDNLWNYKRSVDTDVYGLFTLNAKDADTRDTFSLRTRFVLQFRRNNEVTGIDQIQHPVNQMVFSTSPDTFHQHVSAMGEKAQSAEGAGGIQHFMDFVDWSATSSLWETGRTAGWPSYYRFRYVDENGKVKGSHKQTITSGFHDAWYIDDEGKVKSGTVKNYGNLSVGDTGLSVIFDMLIFKEYYDNPDNISEDQLFAIGGVTGPDRRIGEIFLNSYLNTPGSSFEQFYDAGITIESISGAADNLLVTLDSNGTIRILGGQDPNAFPSTTSRELVYLDKDDVADGFFTDETGTPQQITNEGFVQVCAAGGGNNSGTPVTVWGIHESGKLYGADWMNSITLDTDQNRWKRIYPWLDEEKTIINPEWMTKQDRLNISTLSCANGTNGTTPNDFRIFCATTDGTTKRENGLALAIANNIRRIPIDPSTGNRFPVLDMQPTYGAAGVVTCLDTTYTPPNNESIGIKDNRPLYKTDVVLMGTVLIEDGAYFYPSCYLQQLMDRYFRYWKSEKASSDASVLDDWSYSENEFVDNEVMDILFKENSMGVTYHVPPVTVGHNRQSVWIQTGHNGGDSGYLACFQGRDRPETESDSAGFSVKPFYPVYHIGGPYFGHTGASNYTGSTGEGSYWGLNFGTGWSALVNHENPLEESTIKDIISTSWSASSIPTLYTIFGITYAEVGEVGQGFGNPIDKVDIPPNFHDKEFGGSYFTSFGLYDSFPEYEYTWFHNENVHYMTKGYTAPNNNSVPGDADYDWGAAMVQIFATCGANKEYPKSRNVKTGEFFYDPIVQLNCGGDGVSVQTRSGRIDSASYRILTQDANVLHPAWEPVVSKYEYDVGDLYPGFNLPEGDLNGEVPDPEAGYTGPLLLVPHLHHKYYNISGP